jgi:hypothetical protein
MLSLDVFIFYGEDRSWISRGAEIYFGIVHGTKRASQRYAPLNKHL